MPFQSFPSAEAPLEISGQEPVREMEAGLESDGAYESLMQFLYQAPIGLVQTTLSGDVEMINPMAASLLMPITPNGDLDNLFDALGDVFPQLPGMVGKFSAPTGPICESVRFAASLDARTEAAQTMSLTLHRFDENKLMAMVSDVTLEVLREKNGIDERLRQAARIDLLTQMPNRQVVLELLNDALQATQSLHGEQFAVLFINCDRFKQINDALGHAAGNEVLGLMAERIRSTLRQHRRDASAPDAGTVRKIVDAAGRIGGDEFVVLVNELQSAEDGHRVARRLLDVLAKPYAVRGQQLHVSVSIGVVFRDQMSADADTVLQDSSLAMREAKHAGGSRYVVFESSMHDRAMRRGAFEIELRRALTHKQLFVMYQPVVDLQADPADVDSPPHAAGVEALVRWRHPERGLIPPVDFIGIAEECGLIEEIGNFVLASACEQFMVWRKQLGSAAPRLLAVNLSRGQLLERGFVEVVADILEKTGMPAALLQLEVTESLAAQDESVQAELAALRSLGLTIALDDFGTGYSSLSSLHRLPVETVKIDRSFVTEAVYSAHHRVLIEATISVARSLGMNTVAEGIETREQSALLRALGCKKGQGYFFSKPRVVADLEEWLLSPHPLPTAW